MALACAVVPREKNKYISKNSDDSPFDSVRTVLMSDPVRRISILCQIKKCFSIQFTLSLASLIL